ARCSRESSLGGWCLLGFGYRHGNEFRFPRWLVHRNLERFHDNGAQRFTNEHASSLAPLLGSCVGCRYEKRRGPPSGQERITCCTAESRRLQELHNRGPHCD